MQPAKLVETRHPKKAVAALDGMVEECKGPAVRHRDQPERQLRHLDGHRVPVDCIDALRDYIASRLDIWIGRHRIGRGRLEVSGSQVSVIETGLNQPFGKVANSGDEDRSGSNCRVTDSKLEDLEGRLDLPLRLVLLVVRAGFVDEVFEGVVRDLGGKLGAGVGGAGVTSVSGLGHVDVTREEDEGDIASIGAEQARKPLNPVKNVAVTVTRLGECGRHTLVWHVVNAALPLGHLALATRGVVVLG